MACVRVWTKITSRQNARSTAKTMVAIIQPEPLRGEGGGGVMTGGGVNGGGEPKPIFDSILAETNSIPPPRQISNYNRNGGGKPSVCGPTLPAPEDLRNKR